MFDSAKLQVTWNTPRFDFSLQEVTFYLIMHTYAILASSLGFHGDRPVSNLILFLFSFIQCDIYAGCGCGRNSAEIPAFAKELQIITNFYEQCNVEIYYHFKL